MIIIPAIDLKDGKCVRLQQGKMENVTIYSDDPASMARRWERDGAEILHVVDLDGAIEGRPVNLKSITDIRNAVNITIEVGGGIRDMETIDKLLLLKIDRVVIGTSAVNDPYFLKEACRRFPGKVLAGIDARDGMVAIKGWKETTEKRAIDFARGLEDSGVKAIIFTDIKRDGLLLGPNIKSIKEFTESVRLPVIASGGVSGSNDIKELMKLPLEGVIVGKAIYSGSLDLKEAIRLVKGT
ncbi:MAG: 1-(5-phosphoribosyl)-5-[(5-phosphoribosylamino)methylideneamino]imidazole-4-carboxamide isomerase [Nitrospirota bacterium]